jgi:proline dehydrogenase
LQSIEAAQLATPEGQQGCAAIKLTALGNPALLERVSIALLAVQSLFAAFDEDGDGTISKDEFERGYQRLFQEMSNEPRPLTAEDGVVGTAEDPFSYDWLDTDRDGRVDYVSFKLCWTSDSFAVFPVVW